MIVLYGIGDVLGGVGFDPSWNTLRAVREQACGRDSESPRTRRLEAHIAHSSASQQPTPSHYLDKVHGTHRSLYGGTRLLFHPDVCRSLE